MDLSRTLARHLLQIKAIKLSPQSPFTWASGRRAPIYCDNRIILSHPEVRDFVQQSFEKVSSQFAAFGGVAGVATAGIAHGALLADRLSLPYLYVRSQPKSHGRQNLIEGELSIGMHYLVVEDLISTGGSSLEAVAALRSAGAEVAGVLAIFTYGFAEAEQAFRDASCPWRALCHYDDLVSEAIDTGYVTAEARRMLEDWRRDPLGWSDRVVG